MAALPAQTSETDRLFVAVTDPDSREGRVLLVDYQAGTSRELWKGGAELDIMISPDASRLYVNFDRWLAVVDTPTGLPLGTVRTPHRLRPIMPNTPVMAVSPDGRWLYLINHYFSEWQEEKAVSTFDTQAGRFLLEEVSLSECQGVTLFPLQRERELIALCGGDGVVRFVRIGENGAAVENSMLQVGALPDKPAPGPRVGRRDRDEMIVDAVLDPQGQTLYLVLYDGRLLSLDVASRNVTRVVRDSPLRKSRIWRAHRSLSPDGRYWYLPRTKEPHRGSGTEDIAVFDMESFMPVRVIAPSRHFWGLTLSHDGRCLLAAIPRERAILLIDTASGEELRMIHLGAEPSILVSPRPVQSP